MVKFLNKVLNLKRPILAIALILSICMTLFGTFGTYIAFAQGAEGTYTVTNNIYFNATAMGRSTPEVFKLSISQSTGKDINLPLKTASIVGGGFESESSVELNGMQSTESVDNFGWTTNESTTYLVAARYVDDIYAMNTSMYYENFPSVDVDYPTVEKQLLFDSPINYVNAFCDDNGYDLENIINSTYDEATDYNELNTYHSQLIKTCYGITYPQEPEPLLNKELSKYGGSLNPDTKFLHWFAIGIILIVCFFASVTITGVTLLITGAQTAQHFSDNNLAALKYGVDATYNWSSQLKATWDEEQAIAWAAYLAGNISMQQYQELCKLYTGKYTPLLENTTTDFQKLLQDFYKGQEDLFSAYANGFGFSSFWSNILQYVLIFAIVLIGIYAVYALFFRKKGGVGETRVQYFGK